MGFWDVYRPNQLDWLGWSPFSSLVLMIIVITIMIVLLVRILGRSKTDFKIGKKICLNEGCKYLVDEDLDVNLCGYCLNKADEVMKLG